MKKVKILLLSVLLVTPLLSTWAQEGEVIRKFETGEVKTRKQVLKGGAEHYINYYRSGAVHSERTYTRRGKEELEKAYAEDGTLLFELSVQPMEEGSDVILHFFRTYHSNGKQYREGGFIYRDGYSLLKRVGTWKTFSPEVNLLDEIRYDVRRSRTYGFIGGTSYFADGTKRSELHWDPKKADFIYQSYYPTGQKYIQAKFPLHVLDTEYAAYQLFENGIEVVRSQSGIFYKVINGKDKLEVSYSINYPNGKVYAKQEKGVLEKFTIEEKPLLKGNKFPKLPKDCIVCLDGATDPRCNPKEGKKPKNGTYFKEGLYGKRGKYFTFKRGRLEGAVVEYAANGNKVSSVLYKKGKRNGPFKRWHEVTGALIEEGAYKNDEYHGLEQSYDRYGFKTAYQTYKEGSREGPAKVLGAGAYIIGNFENDQWMGMVKVVGNLDGRLLSFGKRNGFREEGEWIEFYFDLESGYPPPAIDFGVIKEFYKNGEEIKKIIW